MDISGRCMGNVVTVKTGKFVWEQRTPLSQEYIPVGNTSYT